MDKTIFVYTVLSFALVIGCTSIRTLDPIPGNAKVRNERNEMSVQIKPSLETNGTPVRLCVKFDGVVVKRWEERKTQQTNTEVTRGNYSDSVITERQGSGFPGLRDPWPVSAPVGASGTNAWGLCDFGGNVREWTVGAERSAFICDASWRTDKTNRTETAYTESDASTEPYFDVGFRLILKRKVSATAKQ